MSKRIHELAKELGRTNKEVIAALAEKNVEVKSHMSVLSEEQEAMVKKALAPKKEQTEAKEAAARPEGTAEKPEGAAAAPPKKKKIIAVYNAHNSQTGIKDPRGDRKQANRSQQGRPAQAGTRPAGAGNARPEPGNLFPGLYRAQNHCHIILFINQCCFHCVSLSQSTKSQVLPGTCGTA